jgi:hypothetical protein
MKYQSVLSWLVPLIFIFAFIAAGAGLFWPAEGQPFSFTSLRGESVTIYGRGLYRYDTISSAAQEQGQDVVTLVLTLPVLALSAFFAFRGSFRGRLLLTGTLAYFLYTYPMMAFNTAYNQLFLVYVAIFALSMYAFILAMMSFDLASLPQHFSPKLPLRAIAAFLFAAGGFLLLAWLGRIIPPLLQNTTPALENTTSLVIQAMDLGIIVPMAILSAILLLRRSPWGYLLASVAVLKFVTYGTAVCAMGINMILSGIEGGEGLLVVFLTLTLVNLVLAFLLLKNVRVGQTVPLPV